MNKFVRKIPESCNNCFYLPCCNYSNPVCPIQYYEKHLEKSCCVKDKKFEKHLAEVVLYAAHKNPYTVLVL